MRRGQCRRYGVVLLAIFVVVGCTGYNLRTLAGRGKSGVGARGSSAANHGEDRFNVLVGENVVAAGDDAGESGAQQHRLDLLVMDQQQQLIDSLQLRLAAATAAESEAASAVKPVPPTAAAEPATAAAEPAQERRHPLPRVALDPSWENDSGHADNVGSTAKLSFHTVVVKHIRNYEEWNPIAREVCILEILQDFQWAPQLLWNNETAVMLSYVGEPVSWKNIPANYHQQMAKILHDLSSVGVAHNDLYKDFAVEIMVLNGRLHMCDYSWATVDGSYSCDGVMKDEAPGVFVPKPDDGVFVILDEIWDRKLLSVEQHIVVDWTSHFSEEEIGTILDQDYPTLRIREILRRPRYEDDQERVATFSRFYGVNVDDFRGQTDHLIYLIDDHQPTYELRTSSKGRRLVNAAMFDLKAQLRHAIAKAGAEDKNFLVHSTDNIQETKDNLKALGLDDLYTARTFADLRQVFGALNAVDELQYVVC
jgi:hypothetical protein